MNNNKKRRVNHDMTTAIGRERTSERTGSFIEIKQQSRG
jgi:hypothetical protein